MARNDELVVDARNLSFAYGDQQVLRDVSLQVYRNEVVSVMGPSGCGKTTLLRLLVGLERPDDGILRVLGQDLNRLDEDELHRFRRRLGMCFQFGALLNSWTVADNLALPLREAGGYDPDLVALVVRSKLALVGLDGTEDRLPAELSGGMRKRAGLARALMTDPELLLFDEPTSGLDPVTGAELDRTILEVRRLTRTTAVVVTHDLTSAFAISDRLVVLLDGCIAAEGTAADLQQATDPAVREFVGRQCSLQRRRSGAQALTRFVD